MRGYLFCLIKNVLGGGIVSVGVVFAFPVSYPVTRSLTHWSRHAFRVGGGRDGADGKGTPAAPVPDNENNSVVRLAAHPALQHARWQVGV